MTLIVLSLAGGTVLLVLGGDVLVRGAVTTAARLGVSPMVIGITLVGFGTSTPELAASLDAAFRDAPGIAMGNVIGSNIANILLILAVAAVIWPFAVPRESFRRDGSVVFLAALAGVAVVMFGTLERYAGAALVAMLIVYIVVCFRHGRVADDAEAVPAASGSLWVAVGSALAGLGLILVGAHLLVDGAVDLATAAGVSESFIGLTVVAVGTSLPELVTAVVAALRRHSDVAFGNVLGSNIFNVLFILGVTAVVRPIDVPPEIAHFDVWVMLGATVVLLVVSLSGHRVTRIEGTLMLAAYAGYVFWLGRSAGLLA